MSVREYIGARYVPLFSDPIQWDNTKTYQALVVVMNEGTSYVSKQPVPVGVDILNETYWLKWADYNAQLEAYTEEVQAYNGRISAIESGLPISDYSSSSTVTDAINGLDSRLDAIESDSWVTSNKIASDAVTESKIADNSVTTDKIASDAVTESKIADNSVTTDKIASDAVTESKIADNSVTTDKIASKTIVNDDIADNTITLSNLGWACKRVISNDIILEDIEDFCTLDIPTGYYVNSCCYDTDTNIMYFGLYSSGNESVIWKITNWTGKEGLENVTPNATLTIPNNHANAMTIYDGMLYVSCWGDNYVTRVKLDTFTQYNSNLVIGFNLRNAFVDKNGRAYLVPFSQNALYIGMDPFDAGLVFDTLYYVKPIPNHASFGQDVSMHNNMMFSMNSSGSSYLGHSYISVSGIGGEPVNYMISVDVAAEFEALDVNASFATIATYDGHVYTFDDFSNEYNLPQGPEQAYWAFVNGNIAAIPAGFRNGRNDGLPITYNSDANCYEITVPMDLINWGFTTKILTPKLQLFFKYVSGHAATTIEFPLQYSFIGSAGHRFNVSGNTSNGWFFTDLLITQKSGAPNVLQLKANAVLEINTGTGTMSKNSNPTTSSEIHASEFKAFITL